MAGIRPIPSDPEEAFQLAFEHALERLRRSDTFEAEIRRRLERNGFKAETVERAVARLRDRHLINDSKTIDSLVAAKTGKRAVGVENLRSELLRRGAPEELIEERLASVKPESLSENMRALLAARYKPSDQRAKGARLLLSRGFAEDEIGSVLDEFFGAQD